MENKKITTVNEYKIKKAETVQVNLPSGAIFEIQKVSGHRYATKGRLPISSVRDIAGQSEEKRKIAVQKMTPQEQKDIYNVCDDMICIATVNPPISLTKENNKIWVENLADNTEDYYALLKAVSMFSFGGKDLKPFRDEQTSANIGSDGEKISSDAPPDSKK